MPNENSFLYFRNFNREIFTRRPEFCLLYEKLQKTCRGWKREALTEKYPDLCNTIREVNESVNICPNIQNSTLLNPILFRLDGKILKLRDELFVYARDNLAVVNIYIKDATVTKIRRDQKVSVMSHYVLQRILILKLLLLKAGAQIMGHYNIDCAWLTSVQSTL